MHITPVGKGAPCCVSKSCATSNGLGNTRENSLMEFVNSDQMNQLRLDMINQVSNNECTICYDQEKDNIKSFRQAFNTEYETYYDESLANMMSDGSINDFKMRYFDIRFSNICNFKCRTCGSEFSTQWEYEDIKNNVPYARVFPKNNSKEFLNDVIDQIPNIELAYFAGGEPLITEEHYFLLEEMIKQNKTDIRLRYNTNISNLKFKNKDLLGLWKHFQHKIQVSASIDHYGDRAEYTRHGTDWAKIEENFIAIRQNPHVLLSMNTVLSIFNVLTMHEFYQYIIDKKLYTPNDAVYTIYNMTDPLHLSSHILPYEYKVKGKESLEKTVDILTSNNFREKQIQQPKQSINFLFSKNNWEQYNIHFRNEIRRLDKIRGEDFTKTFPELAGLLNE
jgi:hypothetical protein